MRSNSVHCMSVSSFEVGILIIFKMENSMFTVCCRNAHSDWQSTEVVLYVIGKTY